jgi:soluble lytic murein transglycosylase
VPKSFVDSLARRGGWLSLIILLGIVAWYVDRWRGRREHSHDGVILAASARYGVDPGLIKAVVWKESWFDPRATGKSGEIGLMQVMPGTGGDWAKAERQTGFAPRHLYDPARNTLAGTWYLRQQLNRFRRTDNPAAYALAAYNAGPVYATRWATNSGATNSAVFITQIKYPATRQYVESILKRAERYRRDFAARNRR